MKTVRPTPDPATPLLLLTMSKKQMIPCQNTRLLQTGKRVGSIEGQPRHRGKRTPRRHLRMPRMIPRPGGPRLAPGRRHGGRGTSVSFGGAGRLVHTVGSARPALVAKAPGVGVLLSLSDKLGRRGLEVSDRRRIAQQFLRAGVALSRSTCTRLRCRRHGQRPLFRNARYPEFDRAGIPPELRIFTPYPGAEPVFRSQEMRARVGRVVEGPGMDLLDRGHHVFGRIQNDCGLQDLEILQRPVLLVGEAGRIFFTASSAAGGRFFSQNFGKDRSFSSFTFSCCPRKERPGEEGKNSGRECWRRRTPGIMGNSFNMMYSSTSRNIPGLQLFLPLAFPLLHLRQTQTAPFGIQ